MYPNAPLYINGQFIEGGNRTQQPVVNPADNGVIGHFTSASQDDLDFALASAEKAFAAWGASSALERSRILHKVASLTRERADGIARNITLDEGKPLVEARAEVLSCIDHIEWHAEECRRTYGRIIPARLPNVRQMVVRQPIGVCIAFSPWNFPFLQALRKVVAALGAGCTLILKGPEDSPSATVALAQLFHDAGLPAGCLNIVWGEPATISDYLIRSPIVRKLSFTGSIAVGKHLSALAGAHMKRVTMELGGHSPVLVFDDADVDRAADLLVQYKSRNAGQVCIAPSRFFIQRKAFERFTERFIKAYGALKPNDGLLPETTMGPLAHSRRVTAMEEFVADARQKGGEVLLGGARLEGPGNFFAPTVITNLTDNARLMQEEPFGPIAPIVIFDDADDALHQANSLPYGLASYVFTNSLHVSQYVSQKLEAGLVNVNHFGIGLAETPFGGVKESGIGLEGGIETFDGYLTTKFISEASIPNPS